MGDLMSLVMDNLDNRMLKVEDRYVTDIKIVIRKRKTSEDTNRKY